MTSRFSAERIIRLLREAEVEVAGGKTVGQVCRRPTISERTFHRRRRQYGGVTVEDARRLKEPEAENGRLKKRVAGLSPDEQMPQEVVRGEGGRPPPSGSRWAGCGAGSGGASGGRVGSSGWGGRTGCGCRGRRGRTAASGRARTRATGGGRRAGIPCGRGTSSPTGRRAGGR